MTLKKWVCSIGIFILLFEIFFLANAKNVYATFTSGAMIDVTKDNFEKYFSLKGSATYDTSDGIATFTTDTVSQVGSFSLNSKIDTNTNFSLKGKVNIGSNPYGADGISFALHTGNTTDIGIAGAGLGIAGLQNALGFKIDTYRNYAAIPTSNLPGSQIDSSDSDGFGWGRDTGKAPYGTFVTTSDEQIKTIDGSFAQRWWSKDDSSKNQSLSTKDINGSWHDFLLVYDGLTRTITVNFMQTSGNTLTWTTILDKSYSTVAFTMMGSTGEDSNLQQFKFDSFKYQETATVDVKYIDTEGNRLAQGEVTYPDGASVNGTYLTDEKNITGYTFKEMDDGSVTGTASIAANGILTKSGSNGTVVYVYDKNYTVKYDANTGSGFMDDQTFTYNVAQNLLPNNFTKTGYTFSGWNTAVDGSGTNYIDEQSVLNLVSDSGGSTTLYAQWSENQGTATVTYIDDTTDTIVDTKLLTGSYGTTDVYRTTDAITSYEAKGYELVSDNYPKDGVVYDQIDVTQEFEVHLKHGTTTNPEEKNVNQTIHYVYSNETTASIDYTATLSFNRTVTTDKVSGSVTNSEWIAKNGTTFASVTSPVITGYTADYTEIVAVENVTGDTADLEATVTYTANKEKAIVTYIDDTTGEILSTKELTGAYGTIDNYRTDASIATYVAAGYELISDSYPANGVVYNKSGEVQAFEVHLNHVTSDETETNTVNQTIHYVYSSGATVVNDYKASLSFIRTITIDEATGEITYGDWNSVEGTTTFAAVNSPSITGHTPDQAIVAAVPDITSETNDLETIVIYTPNTETATVTYIDDTTKEILSVVDLTGAYGTTDTYRTEDNVASYQAQNYAVVFNDYPTNGVVYDQSGIVKQYEVHMKHVMTSSTEEKTVKQMIYYVYSNGKTAADNHVASLYFTREVITDEVTGEITYEAWEAIDGITFAAVISPVIEGYTADKPTVVAIDGITGNTPDITITVTYIKSNLPGINERIPTAISKNLPKTGEEKPNYLLITGIIIIVTGGGIFLIKKKKQGNIH